MLTQKLKGFDKRTFFQRNQVKSLQVNVVALRDIVSLALALALAHSLLESCEIKTTVSSFNLSQRSFGLLKTQSCVLLHVVITNISDMTVTLVKAEGGGANYGVT